jgi:DNA-binding NtrC family response regulator
MAKTWNIGGLFGSMAELERTVLLVDDNKDIVRMFSQVLRKKGYTVVAAHSGREARDWIERSNFDAAVIDLHLPDANGTDLLVKIQETTPKTARIVLTGSPEAMNIRDSAAKLADAFLLKPVEPEAFLKTIEEKMGKR